MNEERKEKYSQPIENSEINTAKSVYVKSTFSKINIKEEEEDFDKEMFKAFQNGN